MVQLGNDSGSVTKNYLYDAFGNEKNADEADTNPFKYSGEYIDLETNNYYLRARYYEPTTGRFLVEDSVRGTTSKMPNGQEIIDPLSLNLYTYCENDAVNYVDTTGNSKARVLVRGMPKQEKSIILTRLDAYYESSNNLALSCGLPEELANVYAGAAGVIIIGGAAKGSIKGTAKNLPSAQGLKGIEFEKYLTKNIGGNGSFSVGGRQFDGAVGSRWWEAKSAGYWDKITADKKMLDSFKSTTGEQLKIAKQNGATFEIISNTPIPKEIKTWLTSKGIKYTELLNWRGYT